MKVSFASTSLVSSCKDIYVVPILTSVLYIREESKQIREEIIFDTRVYIYAHICMLLHIHRYSYQLTYMFKYDRAILMHWRQIITQVSTNYSYRHAYIYTYLDLLTFLFMHMNEWMSGGTYSSKDDVGYFVDRMIYKKRMLAATSSTASVSATVAALDSK